MEEHKLSFCILITLYSQTATGCLPKKQTSKSTKKGYQYHLSIIKQSPTKLQEEKTIIDETNKISFKFSGQSSIIIKFPNAKRKSNKNMMLAILNVSGQAVFVCFQIQKGSQGSLTPAIRTVSKPFLGPSTFSKNFRYLK